MKRPDDPATPTSRRLLAGLGVRLLVVLAFAWLVDGSGFAGAGDDLLRDTYYGLRGLRDSSQRVILVSIDAPTVTAWGRPPWRAEHLQPVLAAIEKGGAAAVGFVSEPAWLLGADERLTGGAIAGHIALELDAHPVDAVVLREDGKPTATARLLEAAGLPAAGDRVSINYLGRRGLPMVSAADVGRGNIPAASFAGKIVVVGLTAQPYAGLVPTPVGALAPAQVQAHALASVADGVAWSHVPMLVRWLVLALLCAIAMIAAHHLATAGASITAAALVLGLFAADYVLFAVWAVRLGATLPVIAVLAAIALERISERRAIRRHVKEIALWTRQWMQLDSMRNDVPDDEPGYWLRVAGLARLYLGCTSTIVAELPPNSSHLKLRVINGTTAKQIADQRRDVRRTPYRKAHLTLGPVWHDQFMTDGKSTLLVPLVVQSQLRGFWIVNFESRDAVAAPHLALIKTLAREITMALDRRRALSTPARPPGLLRKLLGAGRFSIDLEEVRRAFAAHTQNQQDLMTLGESMPFGVFVATLWGEIRYMNTAMKLVCKHEGIDPASTSNSLPDVLCRLTGFHANEVNQHLRKLVQELEELHVRGRDRIDRAGRDFVLSWLKPSGGDPSDSEQLIVVCALPPRNERRAAAPANVYAVSAGTGASAASVDADIGIATATLAAARMSATLSLKPHADEHAVTAPREKVDLDAPDGPASDHASTIMLLANGTPAFDPEPAPVVPDGTVTFVIAGSSARSSRSLPVVPDPAVSPENQTKPMFKFTVDDPH